MQKFKRISIIFVIIFTMILSSGCSLFSDDGSGHTFKISLDSNPENLDPQIANDSSSISVAKNMFIGLMKLVDDRLITGVAKDYMISDDGLTYTFYLEEGYKWKAVGNFEENVTAHDFVFAFKRLFDPETDSPHAKDYFCILNSKRVNNGSMPADSIGVKALDDYTLEFSLEYPNADFLYLLAQLPASPCNEEFFISCRGKYGLETENIASNGPFYVRYWLYDKYNKSNYIKLTRNNFYSQINRVYPSGVTYLIDTSMSEKLNNFTGEQTDILIDTLNFNQLSKLEYESLNKYNSTLGIVFNLTNPIFAEKEVRELFSLAINREKLESELTGNLSLASGIFPPNTVISGSKYEKGFDDSIISYNKITAEYRWGFVLSEEEKTSLYNINILVCSDFSDYNKVKIITDSWYDAFGIHFGLDVVNKADYDKRISNGEYDIAFISLSPEDSGPVGYVSPFGSSSKYGFTVDKVCKIEFTNGKYITLTEKLYDYITAEAAIIEDYFFIPICHSSVYCYYDEDIEGFEFQPLTNTIIFENAKHY